MPEHFQRMPGPVGALVAVLLLGGTAACSSPGPADSRPAASTTSEAPATSKAPATAAPESAAPEPESDSAAPPVPEPATTTAGQQSEARAAVLPDALVGVWESRPDGGTGTIAYRFTADGRYKYVGMLLYPNTDGDDIQITFVAEGTARVEGDQLFLAPTTATKSRQDPGDPAGDYTDQPAERTPERHGWSVSGDVLTLTDGEGTPLVYDRQSL
ncbi:hypothetical protein SALBM135S_08512 [Streptomyces alboniger]